MALLFFAQLFACGSEPKQPEGVLSQERLAPLMADIHIMEQQVAIQGYPYDSAQALFRQQYLPKAYARHSVDSQQVSRSLDHYLDDPQLLKELYEKIMAELEARKADSLLFPNP